MTNRTPESFISNKLRKLEPYRPQSGETVCRVRMDANESCFPLPERMKKQIAAKIEEIEFNRYPDPLASGACAAFGARYRVFPRYVTAGNGSDELISVIMNAFADRGGKVLMTQPDFSMYQFYCQSYECTPVVLGKADDLTFSPDEMIRRANAEKVQLVIFSNPCNPTGQGISKEDALRIVRNVRCTVVVDEAYMDFWDQSILDAVTEEPNAIVLKTCSKIGFAAARMGFAVANTVLTDYLRAAKSPYNINALTQAAAECFLGDDAEISESVDAIRRLQGRLYTALRQLEQEIPGRLRVYPSHTNFVLVRSAQAGELHAFLLGEGVAVRLYGKDLLRITAGTQDENRELLACVCRFFGLPARA